MVSAGCSGILAMMELFYICKEKLNVGKHVQVIVVLQSRKEFKKGKMASWTSLSTDFGIVFIGAKIIRQKQLLLKCMLCRCCSTRFC